MTIGAMIGDILSLCSRNRLPNDTALKENPRRNGCVKEAALRSKKMRSCMLCMKDCPANAIEILTVDRAAKKFVMRFHTRIAAPIVPSVQNCRFNCLGMESEEYELAALSREPFVVYYGREEDVQFILDRAAQENPDGTDPCQPPAAA